jgi:hypothetical protein
MPGQTPPIFLLSNPRNLTFLSTSEPGGEVDDKIKFGRLLSRSRALRSLETHLSMLAGRAAQIGPCSQLLAHPVIIAFTREETAQAGMPPAEAPMTTITGALSGVLCPVWFASSRFFGCHALSSSHPQFVGMFESSKIKRLIE